MSQQLDETMVNPLGNDVNVIQQKLKVKVGAGSLIFQIALWVLGIIPGIIFQFVKVKADNYLQQLQQKIQKNASQIDNYMEQRVVVLKNCAKILTAQPSQPTLWSASLMKHGRILSSHLPSLKRLALKRCTFFRIHAVRAHLPQGWQIRLRMPKNQEERRL